MKQHHSCFTLFVSIFLFTWTTVLSQIIPSSPDLNADGLMDNVEMAIQIIHHNDKIVADADVITVDGTLDETEIKKAVADYESSLRLKAASLAQLKADYLSSLTRQTDGKPVPVEDAHRYHGIKMDGGKIKETPLWGIQIRREASDIDTNDRSSIIQTESEYQEYLSAITPAQFSFAANELSGNETWIARGIVARPFPLTEFGQGEWSWSLLPSAAFDRVSNNVETENDIDRLTLSAAVTGITPGWKAVGWSSIDAGFDYTTNFDFDGAIYSGHMTWTPIFNSPAWWPNERAPKIPFLSPLRYRLRQYAHLEGGTVDKPLSTSLDSDFLRLGGAVGLDVLIPVGEREWVISADYRYYADLLGQNDDHDNFRASAAIPLDRLGHFSLEIGYEQGQIALTQQEVELVTIGIGVRF